MKLKRSQIPKHLLKYFKPCHEQWVVKNDVIWFKTNAPPESTDKRLSRKHEHFFFMTKDKKDYYFDLDSIREPHKESSKKRVKGGYKSDKSKYHKINIQRDKQEYDDIDKAIKEGKISNLHKMGKNPGDVFQLGVSASHIDHGATYNTKLVNKPILAGCPKGGIVLDPFCGSGITLLEAYKNERKFIGIDGNEKYVYDSKVLFKDVPGFSIKHI